MSTIGYQSPGCVVNWETPCIVQLLLTEMSEITCIYMGVLSSITSANSNPLSVSNVQHFQKKIIAKIFDSEKFGNCLILFL